MAPGVIKLDYFNGPRLEFSVDDGRTWLEGFPDWKGIGRGEIQSWQNFIDVNDGRSIRFNVQARITYGPAIVWTGQVEVAEEAVKCRECGSAIKIKQVVMRKVEELVSV